MATSELSLRLIDAARSGDALGLKTLLQDFPTDFDQPTLASAAALALLGDKVAARQMALGCFEVLRAANAAFLAENPRVTSSYDGLVLLAPNPMPAAECFLIEILKSLPLGHPSSGESSEATPGGDNSECDFEQLFRSIGSNPDLGALVLNYSPLTEANARRLMESRDFHENRRLPAYQRRHYFDFVALLNNEQAPGVGRHILETTCFERLLDWAGAYPARLQFLLEQAPLDFEAVQRIIRHPQFLGVPSTLRNWYEDSSIDANPNAKGLIERFFNETPLPELVSWVGRSRRRLNFLSAQLELPGAVWADFIRDRLFDLIDLDGGNSGPAIHRFLTETPSPTLLAWAKEDENRTEALLRRARLDDDTWFILLRDPEMTKMRLHPLNPLAHDMDDYSWPPLITLAQENPHLSPLVRDAINAALA